MAKLQTKFVCQACAYESPRWIGKCPNCSEWNTFVEEMTARAQGKQRQSSLIKTATTIVPLAEVSIAEEPRVSSGIPEFDRVLGGGIVAGSLVLIGGEPGIG